MIIYEEIEKINKAIGDINRRLNKARIGSPFFDSVGIGRSPTAELDILGTSTPTILFESSDASDPTFIFKTTNIAHQINILLDESAVNDILSIEGQTASIDTQIDIHAQDGQDAKLRLFSGQTNCGMIFLNLHDNLIIKNTVQNKDIKFTFDDGGVSKTITIDASADKIKHSAGTFNFDDDNLTTTGIGTFASADLGTGELTAGSINRASGTLALEIGGTSIIDILSTYINVKQNLFVNETANAKMTMGITINMGAADNEVLAFKSSDIGHGITDFAETDTFCNFVKAGAVTGGVAMQAFTGGTTAFQMAGVGTTANTAKTTGGNAYVYFFGYEKSGTGIGNASANANIFALGTYKDNGYKTIFIVDEDGDYHYDGADGGAFQNENDIALLKELEDILTKDKLNKKEAKKKDIYKKHKVVELGESDEDEGRFVSNKKKTMLILGAIRQLDKRLKVLEN